jgi:adenylosuccinate lyase
MSKYLPTAFLCSAKKRRTLLSLKATPNGLGPPEFRVRYAVRTNVGLFKFDDKTVKLKQEVVSFSPLDSQLYGALFTNARVAALFTNAHHVKTMLEVEAALAQAQAKLGMIPEDAALEIERAVQSLEVDFAQLRVGIANDGFPVIELVRQLRANVSSGATDFAHFGATTQDILDTANALRIRDALEIIRELLEMFIAQLARLARAHRGTIMAGRTHTQRDNVAELAGWLALVTSSLGKIAQDVLLTQSEIAEVRESGDLNRGGSSTMPQKSNPITSELILTIARNATLLPALHHANLHEHERGTHGMQLEWMTLAQMIGLTSGALEKSVLLAENMMVNKSRMLENVRASHGLMLSEALSFALTQHMPKSEAKKLSADLAREALETKRNLIEIARAKVTFKLDWDSLQESNHLGSSDTMIDRMLEVAERIQRA